MSMAPPAAHACLWDYDTLKEESLGQADVAAIVGGNLSKHSQHFYQAKVEYTKKIIAGYPSKATADRYDDLAVAQAKLGNLDEALATLDAKDKLFPGLYTTAANRGTFLHLKGDFAGALTWLNKAIAIDPNAHFGREKYQIMLAEYQQKLAKDPSLSSSSSFLPLDVGGNQGFSASKLIYGLGGHKAKAKDRRKLVPSEPVVALVGMIRFGDAHDMPDVWWALGWALIAQGDGQLAARAFRRAEILKHPRGAVDGMYTSSTLHGAAQGCCLEVPDDKLRTQWANLSKTMDAQWLKGQAAQTKAQAREDAKADKRDFRGAFGF
jgi:tetratricopeptide (TPR) repeat protein